MERQLTLKDSLITIITAIDLINFLLKDHHRRVAIIAYRLGTAAHMDSLHLSNLVLAASLHDVGALSVKERDELLRIDILDPHPHAVLGSVMLEAFSPFSAISEIIKYHHIHWQNDSLFGVPRERIPIESYYLHLADRIEILIQPGIWILDQVEHIKTEIISYSGTLFDPALVRVFLELAEVESFWLDIEHLGLDDLLHQSVIQNFETTSDDNLFEELAYTLSRIIDFRSEYTSTHSYGVAMVAYEIAKLCQMPSDHCNRLKIAGFLHDIGKIAISNEILEKPEDLTEVEFKRIKMHAYYTHQILGKVPAFEDICQWCSMHHERRDGRGYPFHLSDHDFSLDIEILAYADIFTALSENRPYRAGLSNDRILEILRKSFVPHLGPTIFSLIEENIQHLNQIRSMAQTTAFREYQDSMMKKHSALSSKNPPATDG